MIARAPVTVYGIRQCDSCRKAVKWLSQADREHVFHDLREDGLSLELLQGWMRSPHADQLVNRRSTTWRGLGAGQKTATGEALVALLVAHPTLVKRPVFMVGNEVVSVGFDPATLAARLDAESR